VAAILWCVVVAEYCSDCLCSSKEKKWVSLARREKREERE
jgi:hypothetical protein